MVSRSLGGPADRAFFLCVKNVEPAWQKLEDEQAPVDGDRQIPHVIHPNRDEWNVYVSISRRWYLMSLWTHINGSVQEKDPTPEIRGTGRFAAERADRQSSPPKYLVQTVRSRYFLQHRLHHVRLVRCTDARTAPHGRDALKGACSRTHQRKPGADLTGKW